MKVVLGPRRSRPYMDVPAPELACWSNGYKIVGCIYGYFFVLRNNGTLPYAGKVTLRLFDRKGKSVFEKTVDFSDPPNKPGADLSSSTLRLRPRVSS